MNVNQAKNVDARNESDLNKLPVIEPGLDNIIPKYGENLHFSCEEIEKNIAKADMIYISVNTPLKVKVLEQGKRLI